MEMKSVTTTPTTPMPTTTLRDNIIPMCLPCYADNTEKYYVDKYMKEIVKSHLALGREPIKQKELSNHQQPASMTYTPLVLPHQSLSLPPRLESSQLLPLVMTDHLL